MIGLPSMRYSDGTRRSSTAAFGGLDLRIGAAEGTFCQMENMSGEHYPLLSVRRQRYTLDTVTSPGGMVACDGLGTVENGYFCWNGTQIMAVTQGTKRFACIGAYVVIWPDKLWFNRLNSTHGSLENTVTLTPGALLFKDGTYCGEEAAANTLYAAAVTIGAGFHVGDAVIISGCTRFPENNKTPIIREISADLHTIRFYENTFTLPEGQSSCAESSNVTLTRAVPSLDCVCENDNRLWGAKGSTVYASKLGDIFNWDVFDGLDTDSYRLDVGSPGDFTGCCSFLGYPTFFKADHIYKVYGAHPSAFQLMETACSGVAAGCGKSPAQSEGVLFYVSPRGVMAYSGGLPKKISASLDGIDMANAVGACCGGRYWLSLTGGLFVYDISTGLWHRQDSVRAMDLAVKNGLLLLSTDGKLLLLEGAAPAGASAEGDIRWQCVTNPFTEGVSDKKSTAKLGIHLEAEQGTLVGVYIRYNGSGSWHHAATLRPGERRTYYLPLTPRRCQYYQLKLEGTGQCRLFELWREYVTGSALRDRPGRN